MSQERALLETCQHIGRWWSHVLKTLPVLYFLTVRKWISSSVQAIYVTVQHITYLLYVGSEEL